MRLRCLQIVYHLSFTLSFLLKRDQQMIESVDLDFVYGMQHHAQAAFREALSIHPFEVMHGNVAYHGAFILPVRHRRNNDFFKDIRIQSRM